MVYFIFFVLAAEIKITYAERHWAKAVIEWEVEVATTFGFASVHIDCHTMT